MSATRPTAPSGSPASSFDSSQYLDKLVATLGGEALSDFEKKVQCCGGALAFSEPEKSQEMIKGIRKVAYDQGADLIVSSPPVSSAR